ncbi:hypothetical protein BVX98_05805 [bacterium F11]|nr:hypothetical protein BVX98_05805 [bacterium F11]
MNKKKSAGPVWIMGNVFIGAFVVLFFMISLPQITKFFNLHNWTEARCRIVSAEVKKHHVSSRDIGKGAMFSPHVVYQFTVDGTVVEASGYRPFGKIAQYKWAKDIVDAYPIDSESTCYFNPKNPSQAVLVKSFDPTGFILMFVPLLFLFFGFFIRFLASGIESGKIK